MPLNSSDQVQLDKALGLTISQGFIVRLHNIELLADSRVMTKLGLDVSKVMSVVDVAACVKHASGAA